jgi:nitrate/nitrite-specific signal transduction histidine kinase
VARFVARGRASAILNFDSLSFGLIHHSSERNGEPEVINKVRKHAGTRRVIVRVRIEPDRLRFTVGDEGGGFDPEATGKSGHGKGKLKRRASRVSGSVHIKSAPRKGTEVTFEVPFSK